jgi:hypothetical protein
VVPAGLAATADVDDRTLPSTAIGTSIRLDPGVHRLVVRAPGHPDYRAELSLSVGEHRTLKVFFQGALPSPATAPPPAAPLPTQGEAPPRAQAPPAPEPDRHSGVSVRTVLLIGEATVALAGVGLGIGYAVARHGASERVYKAQAEVDASAPGAPDACLGNVEAACHDLEQAIDDHHRYSVIETVGFVTAGAAAGLFVATWTLWPTSRTEVSVALRPVAGGALLSAGSLF